MRDDAEKICVLQHDAKMNAIDSNTGIDDILKRAMGKDTHHAYLVPHVASIPVPTGLIMPRRIHLQ
jgi:hypothetical protein